MSSKNLKEFTVTRFESRVVTVWAEDAEDAGNLAMDENFSDAKLAGEVEYSVEMVGD